MAQHLSYATTTYRPPNAVIPGNDDDAHPTEFDLLPAEGPDLARIKSAIVGTAGLVIDAPWTEQTQDVVVSAIKHGAPAFIETIAAIRGLTVPAAMAHRVGVIGELPGHLAPGGSSPVPNPAAPIAVTTGAQFSRICGFLPVLSMFVAQQIVELSNRTGIDARFFEPPSGSGGQETPGTTPGSATPAPPPPGAPATAGSATPRETRRHGTSRRTRSS
jgi:hypothetical protein